MTANARAWELRAKLFALVGEYKEFAGAVWAAMPDADDPTFDSVLAAHGQADGVACELAGVHESLSQDARDLFTDAARDSKDQSYRFDLDGLNGGAGFPATLARLREAAGLTLAELAEAVGLSRQAIHQLESGASKPSWQTVQALATALGVSADTFRDAE